VELPGQRPGLPGKVISFPYEMDEIKISIFPFGEKRAGDFIDSRAPGAAIRKPVAFS
jgi:hypothetical protein